MLEYQKTLLKIAEGVEKGHLMLNLDQTVAKQNGKTLTMIGFCKFALTRHLTVIVATKNQADTFQQLREHFPKNLMDTIEDWGVRIHRMKE